MAARTYKQFMYSQERMPVMLAGSFTQDGAPGNTAALLRNSIIYAAKHLGSAGNNISIALVAGGTAGSEVVTVTDTAISVQIQSGVSTRTQVKDAIDNSVPAAALIQVTVSGGGSAATLLAATNLAGGTDTVFVSNAKDMTLLQTDHGIYKLILQDEFFGLLAANFSLLLPVAADLTTQIASQQVTDLDDPSMVVRVMSGATPTDLDDGQALYCQLMLRNSGS